MGSLLGSSRMCYIKILTHQTSLHLPLSFSSTSKGSESGWGAADARARGEVALAVAGLGTTLGHLHLRRRVGGGRGVADEVLQAIHVSAAREWLFEALARANKELT
eukprot:682698-Pyramimonas_sp.AAC.2